MPDLDRFQSDLLPIGISYHGAGMELVLCITISPVSFFHFFIFYPIELA